MMRLVMLCLPCAAWLCGCVSTDMEGPVKPEKVYRTGSNIPKRDGSMPDGVETSTVSPGDTRLGPPGMPGRMPGSGG